MNSTPAAVTIGQKISSKLVPKCLFEGYLYKPTFEALFNGKIVSDHTCLHARYSLHLPVLVVLGNADYFEVEGDDDADGEDEAERVVCDWKDGVVPKDGQAAAEFWPERQRRQRRQARGRDPDRDEPRGAQERHGLA